MKDLMFRIPVKMNRKQEMCVSFLKKWKHNFLGHKDCWHFCVFLSLELFKNYFDYKTNFFIYHDEDPMHR